MKKLLAALLLICSTGVACAQTTCSSNLTQTQVLSSFADNSTAAITPRNLRDYVCSAVAGGVLFTTINATTLNVTGSTSLSTLTTSSSATFNAVTNFTSQFQIAGQRMQFPASADTVGGLGTNQTWTGANTWTGTTSFSNAPTGAGITSIFANPQPIGSGIDNTGTFTTLQSSIYTATGRICPATTPGLCLSEVASIAALNTAANTSLSWVANGSSIFTFNSVGHFNTLTATVSPTTGCIGGTAVAGSTDYSGRVTFTSTDTTCPVLFANLYTTAPFCVVTPNAVLSGGQGWMVTTSTTGFVYNGDAANATAINYICTGF